uniref:Fragile site-associated protein C-terminal domain-containing protein n=1 Tax=Timema monikensis TaxID=170555 RepID=A0A7R9HKD3_9NEOP|nr:unnamed protein product [Timema monikensis]
MVDDPPRYMGEGFVVLSSNNMELYYYMDETGLVPEEPEMLQLANGDIVESAPPIWGMDIKCGKGTDFSYGPWADRQREHLFKFFFPNDYGSLKVTKAPQRGEKRQVQSFDIRLSTLSEATVDLLFSKNKETNAVHINVGPGSYLEVTMPWVVLADGYTTKVTGQLLHLEATTSLQYRSLVESETLEFTIKCHYPIRWNDHQEWLLTLTGCKATANLIYAHKWFFQDLINDWANKSCPDLLYFVPYTWKINLLLKEFELITLCNEYNWIDCSSQNQENSHIAFCGELFDLSFDLSFNNFLPTTIPLRFWIQGESVDLTFYLPEVCSSHSILLAIDTNIKILCRDGVVKYKQNGPRKWRNVCHRRNGWVDCWAVPIVALCINYVYHPIPPLGPSPQADITTPEKEEILLSPMRIPRCRKPVCINWSQDGSQKLDPTSLSPDQVSLDLEIGPSVLLLYGSLLRSFLHLKENIFGEDQSFTDMQQSRASSPTIGSIGGDHTSDDAESNKGKGFDPRQYRPFDVTVYITMHDIQAHLVKNCSDEDPTCPMILLERLGFEMKKSYKETQLQLLLSPSTLLVSDTYIRTTKDSHLNQGHLMLSGLQVRGHAMFSDENRTLDQETLEYAWLVEIQLGKLSCKITAPQLHHLLTSLETLVLLIRDAENCLCSPRLPQMCHHGFPPLECTHTDPQSRPRCPSGDDIKYRMTRFAIDALDIYLVEGGTAFQVWASPIRVTTCNLHGQHVKSGVTGVLPAIKVRQLVSTGSSFGTHCTNSGGSGRSHGMAKRFDGNELWLEIGSLSMGPLVVEAAISLPTSEETLHLIQHSYLRIHDKHSKRLWFLWTGETSSTKTIGKCGCIGGCVFFGKNQNGAKFFKPSRQDVQDGINMAAFRINAPGQDPGFGQSILHEGQLMFHTPPYGSQDVLLQEPANGWDSMTGGYKKVCQKICTPKESKNHDISPVETCKEIGNNESPSPISSHNDKRPPSRRFSYTSANNRIANNIRDVPYARLMDHSPTNLLQPKLDSDSKLNNEHNISTLSVPEKEQTPKSSVSDSKLAVNYFTMASAEPHSLIEVVIPGMGGRCNASDTHHILDKVESGGQEVQRTVSMSSENHSEAFYSADEEVISQHACSSASRTSSLRHSAATSLQDTFMNRKKFSSEINIVPNSSHMVPLLHAASTGTANTEVRTHLTSHRSDHEIHTPEHRNQQLACGSMADMKLEGTLIDSSDTHSLSSTSFISAVSSQEDMTLVNLHVQVNKPIVDSPLLMSSYITHLSQVGCHNWTRSSLPLGCDALTVPLFEQTESGHLIYIGYRYTPRFETLSEGFTSFKMVGRPSDHHTTPPHSTKTPTHPYVWDTSALMSSESGDFETDCEEELLNLQNEYGNRTTLIIKLKGDMDVMITPLVLESLQRFIDAVTPTMASQHPLTVLNHLHARCVSKVEDANILKRDKSLSYLSQFQTNSKRSTTERNTFNDGHGAIQQGTLQTDFYEESISTQTQGTIILPKVNITVLQASVVEEIISFSALDNIRDLTCVSLFAICFDNITTTFHFGKQAREVVQTFHRPAVLPSGHKKTNGSNKIGKPFLLGHQAAAGITDTLKGEPVFIETSEKQQEEIIITLNIGKIHTQLRRLRNESSILKDAVITAIPSQYSRVLFTCTRVTSPIHEADYYHQQPSSQTHEAGSEEIHHSNSSYVSDEINNDDKLGFIMFECGLEGVSLKVVQKSQFEKEDNENYIYKNGTHPNGYNTKIVATKDEVENTDQIRHSTTNINNKNGPNVKPFKEANDNTGFVTNSSGDTYASTTVNTASSNLVALQGIKGNTSSCVIEFKTVWFNFAAPPRAPITRKIDFTRLDWNLLSTASPAINAWMNPSNRFAIRVVHMVRTVYRRSTAIVACLMAEALDVQGLHLPLKSRYGRYTPLAKTLQEDPSCQLCCVLRKFMLQTDLSTIEENLHESDMPLLSTLRQGVIVLSRQWKYVLYTPLLLEHNYKSKHVKPLNVTFSLPEPDEENVLTEGEYSGEDCELTDECAMLLNTHGESINKVLQLPTKIESKPDYAILPTVSSPQTDHLISTPGIMVGCMDNLFNSPSPPSVYVGLKNKRHSLPPSYPPSSSRASIVFPIMSANSYHNTSLQKKFEIDPSIGYVPLKKERGSSQAHNHESNPSLNSETHGSQHSVNSLDNNMSPTAPATSRGTGPASGEDLYSWMAKQQDFMNSGENRYQVKGSLGVMDSKINTMTTEDTLEDPNFIFQSSGGYNFYPMHDSLRLLDAHLIFEPLLSCLGVMPQQMISNLGNSSGPSNSSVSSFETWGSNLSLVGGIETLRIDIVVSEFGKTFDKKKSKSNSSGTSKNKHFGGKFYLDIPPETPAFLCEKIGLELDLKKMADMTVDDMIQKRNILYISRGQLKKHTSTIINVGLNVRYISQQVNMPLLRLLHQISNMYQNVKETQLELKEQQPEVKRENSANLDIGLNNGSSSPSNLQKQSSLMEEKIKGPISSGSSVFIKSFSQQKFISPSSSLHSRPQSFAQKLRSTTKSVKGYMNLSEGITTPTFAMSPSGSGLEHITIASEKSKEIPKEMPKCWKTVYFLLDLYAIKPETKTLSHRFSVAADTPNSINKKFEGSFNVGKGTTYGANEDPARHTKLSTEKPIEVATAERTRLILFGVARIHRTRILAMLSGLKLEAEITSLHSSLTCRKKSRPASMECSLTGQVGRTMIVLLEGVAPNQQTVVKVTVGKTQALYSSVSRRSKDKNSGLLTIGAVNIDIPQHPVALHGMMTRGSKQLSSTLQELRTPRTSSRISRGTTADEVDFVVQHSPRNVHSSQTHTYGISQPQDESNLLHPLIMQFSIILQSLSITAALLPSLQAQYKMDQVNSTGMTGSKAKFTIDLPHHSLSFTTKLQVTEANLPSEASIELPQVHVSAEYIQDGSNSLEAQFADGVVLRQGSYLSAVADIGVFEHSLTTDLLNHLVFVQKVFMKEVNEVVQKVYGGEKPVPLWLEGSEESSLASLKKILFSLVIRIKRIQLTATTPTNSAVRLETGAVEFQLSNRVQNVSGACQPNPYMKIFGKAQVEINLSLGQLHKNIMFEEAEPEFQQYAFFKTRIGLRNAFQDEMVQGEDKEVVLITLRRPLVYFQPMAVDKAILVWLNYKNAYEYWNEQRSNLNKEVLTATQQVFEKVPFGQLTSQLSSPHLGTLFLQLTVDDIGICLPLNPLPLASWGLKRQLYDTESHGAVVVTLESTSISACSSGSLVSKGRFVGLCLRFADDFETSLDDWKPDMNDSAIMNLCVVSEGTYEVCSRTIAQKQGSTENAKWFLNVQWQMEGVDIHLDVNVGKQLSALGHTLTMLTGSQEEDDLLTTVEYDSDEAEIIDGNAPSLTTAAEIDNDRYMLGELGRCNQGSKRRSKSTAVYHQLQRRVVDNYYVESIALRRTRNLTDSLPAFVFDPSLDAKKRSKLIEKEMNEQAKIINDLRSLGASHGTIEQEMKRLQELEAMVFKDFRRDMIQKLRRQSVKASSIKGKLGIGSKMSTYRSKSFIVPSPTPEHHVELESTGQSEHCWLSPSEYQGTVACFGLLFILAFMVSRLDLHVGLLHSDIRGVPDPLDLPLPPVCAPLPQFHPANALISIITHLNVLFVCLLGVVWCGVVWCGVVCSPDEMGGVSVNCNGNSASFDSSPHSGPSRSASLRVRGLSGPRVTFSDTHNICRLDLPITGTDTLANVLISAGYRQLISFQTCVPLNIDPFLLANSYINGQSSLPSAGSELSLPEGDLEWPNRNHINIGGEKVELRRKPSAYMTTMYDHPEYNIPLLDSSSKDQGGTSPGPYVSAFQKPQEPSIDFELDVKVFVNSGKCVLHTKDPSRDDELKLDYIFMGTNDPALQKELLQAPSLTLEKACDLAKVSEVSREQLSHLHTSTSVNPILSPVPVAVDIGELQNTTDGSNDTLNEASNTTYDEPHHNTDEPVVDNAVVKEDRRPVNTMFNIDQDSSWVSAANTGNYVYASFPVDVIVYFHMQPSTFRFSCLPVSRVECMLQLPSLDLVFSSKRAEEELNSEFSEWRNTQPFRSTSQDLPASRFDMPSSAVGGLSVTGCLADFSVYIFHPYGGGKKTGRMLLRQAVAFATSQRYPSQQQTDLLNCTDTICCWPGSHSTAPSILHTSKLNN